MALTHQCDKCEDLKAVCAGCKEPIDANCYYTYEDSKRDPWWLSWNEGDIIMGPIVARRYFHGVCWVNTALHPVYWKPEDKLPEPEYNDKAAKWLAAGGYKQSR